MTEEAKLLSIDPRFMPFVYGMAMAPAERITEDGDHDRMIYWQINTARVPETFDLTKRAPTPEDMIEEDVKLIIDEEALAACVAQILMSNGPDFTKLIIEQAFGAAAVGDFEGDMRQVQDYMRQNRMGPRDAG